MTGVIGTIYAIWLIYAAGLGYLLMAVVFIAVGIPIYLWARHEQGAGKIVGGKQNMQPIRYFDDPERALCIAIIVVALIAIYAFVRGLIQL